MSTSAWDRSRPSGSPSESSASAGRPGPVPAKVGNTRRPATSSGSSDLPAALGAASVRHAARRPGRAVAAFLLGLPLLLGVATAAQAYEYITISAPPDANEGHAGTTDHTFKVRLSGPVSGEVNFEVCFSGTATRTVDYDPLLGAAVQSANCVNGRIPRGWTTPDSAIGIRVAGDTFSESGRWRGEYGETVTAHLTLVGAQPWDLVGRGSHRVTHTILNDDVAVRFRKADVEGREGKRVRIQVDLVERTQGYPHSVTVPFTYTRGTASPGDFDASRTSLTFRRGQTSGDLYVDLPDDSNFESDETFKIDLDTAGFPDGMYVSGLARTTVTIKDNDYSISTDSGSYTVREDEGGVSIAVTISPAQERTVGLRVGFSDINASGGQDYIKKHHSFPGGILTFHPGETTKRIFVPVVNDGVFENNELLHVTLTQTVGPTDPESRDVVIKDHRPGDGDYTSKLILERTSQDTVSERQSATFRLTMHPPVQEGSTVAVLLSQSADDGGRANWIAGAPETHAHYKTVSFARGDSEKTLTVPIRSDGRDTNGTLTVAAMAPGAHPASEGTFTARGQKVTAKVRIRDTVADGDPLISAPQTASTQDAVGTAVCDTASLKSAVQGYAAETHHGTAHVTRWKKVLAAFGDDNGYTTMTAAEAQTYADRGWSRWDPVVEALQCLENAGSDEPEPDIPGIAVTGGNGIVEGGDAVFTVHAEWAPSSDLAVTVKVDDDETSDFVAPGNEGTQTVVILAGQASATLTVATENDGTDEPDGSVSVTVEAGSGYMLGSPETAAVAVADDDGPPVATPVVRIAGGSGIAEGGTASFTLTATPAPAGVLTVTVDVTDSGQFATSGQTGTQTVTLGTTGTATLTVATADDDADEADGHIAATVRAGTGYTVAAAPDDTAAVAVADNDDPVVRIAAGNGVTEGAPATFTLTATPAPHADLTVNLAVTQNGDYAAAGQTGTREVVIPTEGSVTLEVATVNDTADEPDGSVTATLAAGSGYMVAASPDDAASVSVADDDVAAAGVPTLSVNDVEVKEGPYRRVTFTVTLSQASDRYVSFSYRVRESNPVSAKRNKDFWASTQKNFAGIRPGQTEYKIMAGMVIDDSHDEDPETFEVVLSDAHDAVIADAVGVATIVNSDPMPQAWLGRLGRTLAQQALDGITGRLTAPRTPGAQGTLAGQAFSLRPGGTETPTADPTTPAPSTVERLAALVLPGLTAGGAGGTGANPAFGGADPLFGGGIGDGDAGAPGFRGPGGLTPQSLNLRDLLLGSSFTATGQPDALGGSVALWGRAALATFDGQEDTFALDGEVLTGLLGVDYARDRWLLGVSLLQSASTGGYLDRNTGATPCPAHDLSAEMRALVCDGAVRAGDGKVEATLTAAVPYAAFQASERLHLWGAAGYGAGEVTLTPETGDALKTDLDWTMAQLGVRGTVLAPVANDDSGLAGGPALAVTSDALWARTTSEKVQDGLAASESDVTRLRLGLEGSWLMALEDLGQVTPKLAVGARHDGGDAETGFGVELGGGLAWNMPTAGLALNVEGRTLLTHREEAFQDQGLAASLVFDPDPATPRGPSVTLRQDWGGQATGGVEALFASNPLAQRQSTTATRRWAADLAWGFPAWDGAFTSSPLVGLGLAPGSRDYRLGWRLVPATAASAFALEVQATRREPDEAVPEHRLGLELSTRW